jgi:predicted N-formylglutamate amidohydrolase
LFLLLGDHAGNGVPHALDGLGLGRADLDRHIALDIGVAGLGARLSAQLDAPFVAQRYSRLVIDCNRSLADTGSIAAVSDGTRIPGNADLPSADRQARAAAIFAPYHAAIAALIAERDTAGRPTVLVSLHSFTPSLSGVGRPWQLGVLYGGGQAAFARRVLRALERESGLTIGDNEPYRMDATDHTIPRHAFAAGRGYVEIEVRQDEIADEAGLDRIAAILARALRAAAADDGAST